MKPDAVNGRAMRWYTDYVRTLRQFNGLGELEVFPDALNPLYQEVERIFAEHGVDTYWIDVTFTHDKRYRLGLANVVKRLRALQRSCSTTTATR